VLERERLLCLRRVLNRMGIAIAVNIGQGTLGGLYEQVAEYTLGATVPSARTHKYRIYAGGRQVAQVRPEMHDEEGVHLPEQDVVGLYEVAPPRVVGMVGQEGAPLLSTVPGPNASHVFLDRAFGDSDAKLKQLAPDALRAPEDVAFSHAADQVDGVGGQA
jgi:hypothetical protein